MGLETEQQWAIDVLEDVVRQAQYKSTRNNKLDKSLFPKQRAFIKDRSTRKAALCSRRAGKSHGAAYYLYYSALEKPESINVFIGISKSTAEETIWDYLLEIDKHLSLGSKILTSQRRITLHNGSKIYLTGADKKSEVRKLLGKYFDLCIIDECAAMGVVLDELVKEAIIPTTWDYDGTICLLSTPGVVCDGLFYDITTGEVDGWSVHKWTVVDNDMLPRKGWSRLSVEERQEKLNKMAVRDGVDPESSVYKRHYLGEWVQGGDSLVYPFNDENLLSKVPSNRYNYIMSIDYGVSDPCAVVVGAYNYNDTNLYIVDEFKEAGMTPAQMADITKLLYDQYKPVWMVVDGNGIGKAFIAQMTSQYRLPYILAEKTEKVVFVDMLGDDFRSNRIKILETCEGILEELHKYTWQDPKRKILSDTQEDHYMDALLYLWRKSRHHHAVKPGPEIAEAERLRMEELNRVENIDNTEWWDE